MNATELENGLAHFSGSQDFFVHRLGKFNYTEGVQFLAENAGGGAYWLLDLIGSYQPKVLNNRRLAEFQLWELVVDQTTNTAIVTCREDSDMKPTIEQEIHYTDFPLPKIKLYLENYTLMLPSER